MLMRLEKPLDVQWLLGDPLSLDEAPEIPFHPLRLQFAADLSKALMADPQTRSMPDVATFAFWCRRANLEKAAAAQDVGVGVRLGLGLVFHISPSNVPINFAYSLIFALLAGNSSVLRLSSKESAQEQVVLSALRELLQQTPYTSLRGCLLVMRYERNDEITEYWLQRALGRIVWGGDTTVAHLRSLQCHPRSREVAFADRYSMGVVSAEALVALDDARAAKALRRLVQRHLPDAPERLFVAASAGLGRPGRSRSGRAEKALAPVRAMGRFALPHGAGAGDGQVCLPVQRRVEPRQRGAGGMARCRFGAAAVDGHADRAMAPTWRLRHGA